MATVEAVIGPIKRIIKTNAMTIEIMRVIVKDLSMTSETPVM